MNFSNLYDESFAQGVAATAPKVFVFRDRPSRRDDVLAFYGDGALFHRWRSHPLSRI
jgi:hypothetical protein